MDAAHRAGITHRDLKPGNVMLTKSGYGQSIWDPVQVVGRFTSPIVVTISMFTVVVATLAVNIAANVVSPANDFANAFPRLTHLALAPARNTTINAEAAGLAEQ